jgi:hypothetical protein
LRNTKKDSFLVPIDRSGGESREEETWICESGRMSSHYWHNEILDEEIIDLNSFVTISRITNFTHRSSIENSLINEI